MATIKGTAVAPGLAIGRVHVVPARPESVSEWAVGVEEVDREVERLWAALRAAEALLDAQHALVREAAGERDAGILAVHRMVLQDPGALEEVERTIREDRINAEAAVQDFIEKLSARMGQLEGAHARRTAADISEPWRIVLDALLQQEREQFVASGEKVILAAGELTPQVVTLIEHERILAIITESGGRFSHGAVLARSLGIPCVVGLPDLLRRLEQGMQVLVDGNTGTVVRRPEQLEVDEFLVRRRRLEERKEALAAHAELPATSRDGRTIRVEVNIGSLNDLSMFPIEHCDGVGLLRTEFLYIERSQFPSEEEQFRLYRRVIEKLEGRPLTLRTLDIGGDKQLPYFATPREENPALGWRGLRITLAWPDLLHVQLRAALRASAAGEVRIMLPMVTSAEEVATASEILGDVRRQLSDQGYEMAASVPLGVMIEVPSSIWVLGDILGSVDFVSVGTNDLIQYLLAVDRDNPKVSKDYEPNHPAVMRALDHIGRVAQEAGKPCGVCGEIAGDPAFALTLFGMGYSYLSMSPYFLAEIRSAVRHSTYDEARALAREVVASRTAGEVRHLLSRTRDRLHERVVDQRSRVE